MLTAKNRNLLLGLGVLVFIFGVIFLLRIPKGPVYKYTIGIAQTAPHPALDAAREGYQDYLKEKLGDQIGFVVNNAQGSAAQAHLIAQSFHNNAALNGILAIATMTAQAAMQNASDKPLFVVAITDPAAIGLDKAAYACGASDKLDAAKQIELLRLITPQARSATLFYNGSEINAQITAKNLQDELIKNGYEVHTVTITQQSEIPFGIERALQKGDVIISPIDNTIATAISFIAHRAVKAKKPFFVSDNLLVKQGALAAAGVDYYELGRQTAACTFSVLVNGQTPDAISFTQQPQQRFVVNESILAQLGLPKPDVPADKIIFIK